jgi:hypothetical protein
MPKKEIMRENRLVDRRMIRVLLRIPREAALCLTAWRSTGCQRGVPGQPMQQQGAGGELDRRDHSSPSSLCAAATTEVAKFGIIVPGFMCRARW